MSNTPASANSSPFDPTQPPTPSLLLYFFADRVLPKAMLGTKAPLGDVNVSTGNLAREVFAAAFWNLRESGLIRLDVIRQKVLFVNTTSLQVVRTGQGTRDSLEGAILRQLTGDPKRDTVKAIVMRWYGKDVPNPDSIPVAWAESEGVTKGFIDVVDAHRNVVAATFLGKTNRIPNREKIITLEPAFSQVFSRWQAFKAHEAELAKQLVHDVSSGISARRESTDNSID